MHLRGHDNILKRLLLHAGAFNLGRLLRETLGVGTPRGLQGRAGRLQRFLLQLYRACRPFLVASRSSYAARRLSRTYRWRTLPSGAASRFTTGC